MNDEHKRRILDAVSSRAWGLDISAAQAEARGNTVVAEDRKRHAERIWEAWDALVLHWLIEDK